MDNHKTIKIRTFSMETFLQINALSTAINYQDYFSLLKRECNVGAADKKNVSR